MRSPDPADEIESTEARAIYWRTFILRLGATSLCVARGHAFAWPGYEDIPGSPSEASAVALVAPQFPIGHPQESSALQGRAKVCHVAPRARPGLAPVRFAGRSRAPDRFPVAWQASGSGQEPGHRRNHRL